MPEYAYTKVSGKLKDFLGKVRSLGVPNSLTTKWLESVGYKSSNDRSILGVIRQIKFIDDGFNPTEKWVNYRGSNHKQVLADGIREGYPDLYSIYPDAHNRSTEELENFFGTKSTAGRQVVTAIVGTFRALCDLADFSSATAVQTNGNNVPDIATNAPPVINVPNEKTNRENSNFTPKLHIDVQIHISPDATPQQIEQIFESMAKHLYRIKD